MTRRRRTAGAAAVITATAAVSAWFGNTSALDAGPLRGLTPDEHVEIVNLVGATKPTWHYGSFVVCLKDDPPVVLDSISPSIVGDLRVAAVGVKDVDGRDLAGSWPGALPKAYRPMRGFEVAGRCDQKGGTEIVLQLDSPPTTSAVNGFVVSYHRGRRHFRTGYSARIVLCTTAPANPEPAEVEILGLCRQPH